jgi:hypothetical protein
MGRDTAGRDGVTADAAHASSPRPSPLEVFELRAWARAKLWQAGEFDLHEAVDELQRAAERDGLVDELGQDRVQEIIAKAFEVVIEAPG